MIPSVNVTACTEYFPLWKVEGNRRYGTKPELWEIGSVTAFYLYWIWADMVMVGPATSDQLSTEFVCIPIPFERSESPDGDLSLSCYSSYTYVENRQKHLNWSRKFWKEIRSIYLKKKAQLLQLMIKQIFWISKIRRMKAWVNFCEKYLTP